MRLLLQHRLRRAESSSRPPLLLLLHGVGSNEDDLFGLLPWLDPRYTVVSARAPLPYPPGYGWFPLEFRPEGLYLDEAVALETGETLAAFIRECHERYGTDPERTVLMGFSQGAVMSLLLLLTQPALVSATVLMSGRLLPQAAARAAHYMELVGKPVFVAHGVYDSIIPIDKGREIKEELERYPVLLTYKEYPMGHEVSPRSMTDIQAFLTEFLGAPPPAL